MSFVIDTIVQQRSFSFEKLNCLILIKTLAKTSELAMYCTMTAGGALNRGEY